MKPGPFRTRLKVRDRRALALGSHHLTSPAPLGLSAPENTQLWVQVKSGGLLAGPPETKLQPHLSGHRQQQLLLPSVKKNLFGPLGVRG